MTQINPLYNAICFGTLLSALDRIGVSLPIVARQASELLTPMLGNIMKILLGDRKVPESLSEVKVLAKEIIMERDKIVEKLEMDVSKNQIETNVTGCMYLDIAKFSKSLGCNACPTCLFALMMSAFISALKLGTVSEATFVNDGDECHVRLVLLDRD